MDIQTFANQLRECGLLYDKRLEKAVKELAGKTRDARAIAKALMQRNLLTPYQVNNLLTGKGKDLVLGQYRKVERLGQGATGETFKAVHATMGRMVVIREMAPHLTSDPSSRTKFTREVQAIAQLSHTNILTAFDAFEVDGKYILVMEYVEGMDLAALVTHAGPLPNQLACNFIRQTALGLQHAFERGVAHCNIRPENILIAGYQAQGPSSDSSSSSAVPRGVVKILNLGLANLSEEIAGGRPTTKPGCALVLADYIAPETAANQKNADIRSDLYRLGCILYFTLSGRLPFPLKTNQEKFTAHQTKEPAAIEKICPEVPVQLGQIIRKAMSKNPDTRFQTPSELAQELTPFCVSAVAVKRP